jgi:hypothetical protein
MRRPAKQKFHSSGWVKKIKISIVFIILVGIFAGLIFVLKGYVQRKWDKETRFTVISFSPEVVIKSFDRDTRQGIILKLPSDLQIESVQGRGKWRAEVIADAGELDWAASSIADYLGISYTSVEGELEWWDKLMWSTYSKNILWKEINFSETAYVEKHVLPDGVEVLTLTSNWDLKAREWFYDQKIASQALGVEIVNSTSASGLGAGAARIVESMGFKVRNLTSTADNVEECFVKSKTELKENVAVRKLLKTFGCRWETSDSADIILILGKKYLQWKDGN